ASFCGLYGIRPTHGRLDLTGMMAQAPSSDTTGWFARDAKTFARVSEVLLGEPIPASLPTRLVVAVDAFGFADAETAAALGPMVRKLSALVKEVREDLLAPPGLSVWARAQRTLQPYEAWLTFKDWIDRDNPRFAFSVARTLVLASTIAESERQWAAMMRAEACARLAWMVVGAVWVTLAIASGLYFSFPVFFVALLEEFGWPRGATAAAFSISSIVQGAFSPMVGILVDRVGPRRVMLGGACLLGGACVLASRIDSLWSLYLVTGVLAAAGLCAVSWIPSGALIARWFTERRGSMMGLAFSGMGAGVLVIGPLSQWLIIGYGWRAAYLVIGVGTLLVLVPLVSLGVREAPVVAAPGRGDVSGPTPRSTDAGREVGDALRTRVFWALFFAYLCTPLAVFSVVTHQVAFAVDHGFPRLFVAGIFGLTGLLSTVGRIVFGVAADRIGRTTSATISYGCTAVGTLCLLGLE